MKLLQIYLVLFWGTGFLGAQILNPPTSTTKDSVNFPEYSIIYKGVSCIKNNGRKNGKDVKIYFQCIPENMRPNEMSLLPFDSLIYDNIITEKTCNAPALTIFEGKHSSGVTLICYLKESANERKRQKRKRLITCLDALNGIHFTVSRGAFQNIPGQAWNSQQQWPTGSEDLSIKPKWRTQITANLILNPMGMLSKVIANQKDELVEKKYCFLSADEIDGLLKKQPSYQNGIKYDFAILLENGESTYKVYFDAMPK